MSSPNYNDLVYTTMCSERTLQSDTNGFFLQIADHVTHFVGKDWLESTFGKIQTDRKRIEVLFNDKQIRDLVCDTLSNVQCIYRKKDAKISRDKREDAEGFMKKENPAKALIYYCQSVLRAPPKDEDLLIDAGKSLPLALWGRSKALIALGALNCALSDLQLALKEGLPDEYKSELYIRMALCSEHLGDGNRAKVAYALAQKLAGNFKEVLQQVKSQLKIGPRKERTQKKCLPEISHGPSDMAEAASALLEVKESKNMGKYFVAKKAIATGDVLVVEEPQAACLLPDCFGSHCHHCFQRFIAPIGCPNCSSVAFCSINCRDKSCATYHKYECKILNMLIGSGMSILCHVALRMVTQNDLERSLQIHRNRSLDRACTLCGHADKRESKDFLQRTLMAAFLLRCLQKSGFFPNKTDDQMNLTEEEIQIGELLLFYLQILQFNAHEIYETKYSSAHRFRTARTAYIGVGIYPTVALFNHDCEPGVLRYFSDQRIVIVAVKPHKPGDVVAENYGPVFLKKSLPERQRTLLSRYWFKCECTPCKENWIGFDKLKNEHARLRCPNNKCDNLFTQPVRDELTCNRCKENVSFKDAIKQLSFCEKQYQLGFEAIKAQEPKKAIAILSEAVDLFYRIANPPHKDTHLAQLALRTCFADSGNTYECLVSI